MSETVSFGIGSSIITNGKGKYRAVIHFTHKDPLAEPISITPEFDTMREAMECGSAILTKGRELMQQKGMKTCRVGTA